MPTALLSRGPRLAPVPGPQAGPCCFQAPALASTLCCVGRRGSLRDSSPWVPKSQPVTRPLRGAGGQRRSPIQGLCPEGQAACQHRLCVCLPHGQSRPSVCARPERAGQPSGARRGSAAPRGHATRQAPSSRRAARNLPREEAACSTPRVPLSSAPPPATHGPFPKCGEGDPGPMSPAHPGPDPRHKRSTQALVLCPSFRLCPLHTATRVTI